LQQVIDTVFTPLTVGQKESVDLLDQDSMTIGVSAKLSVAEVSPLVRNDMLIPETKWTWV